MSKKSLVELSTLSSVLEEIGYVATSHTVIFRSILKRFEINETVVAEVLGKLVSTYKGLEGKPQTSKIKRALRLNLINPSETIPSGWNFSLVVDSIITLFPRLNWFDISKALDYDEFYLAEYQAFELLIGCFKRATRDLFPLETVVEYLWNNSEGQLSFLRYAIQSPPEVFTFEHAQNKIESVGLIQSQNTSHGINNHAWLCQSLIKTLCKLGELPTLTKSILEIMDYPLRHCPELLLIGVATCDSDWGKIKREVAEKLIPIFIEGHSNSAIVFKRIWIFCKDRVIEVMSKLYATNFSVIFRILDICEELKALPYVLHNSPYSLTLGLASLALTKEYLNLEKWLESKISTDGTSFVEAIVKYLDINLTAAAFEWSGITTLTFQTLDIYLKILQKHCRTLVPHLALNVDQLQARAIQLFPEMHSLATELEHSKVSANVVEEESDAFFQRIYSGQISLEDALSMLKNYKDSQNSHKRAVFACMIHNLLDESQFFSSYSEHDARYITAVLWGQLIQHHLVPSSTVRSIFDSILKSIHGSNDIKSIKFGLTVVEQCKDEIINWPQYCAQVLTIPRLYKTDPCLAHYLIEALRKGSSKRSKSFEH